MDHTGAYPIYTLKIVYDTFLLELQILLLTVSLYEAGVSVHV